MTDLQRRAVHYGVQLNWHPRLLEIDASRLLRATLVAGQLDAMPEAVEAIFNAIWLAPAPLATAAEVAAAVGAAGLDAEELKRRMDEPAAQILLEEATAKAVSRGVFVGDAMFFANDRLHFVQAQLERAA